MLLGRNQDGRHGSGPGNDGNGERHDANRIALFGVRVPLRAHTLADPEKGTGVAMICTFGDITDVVWWRELGLPVRAVIQANGTFKPVTWGDGVWQATDAARAV